MGLAVIPCLETSQPLLGVLLGDPALHWSIPGGHFQPKSEIRRVGARNCEAAGELLQVPLTPGVTPCCCPKSSFWRDLFVSFCKITVSADGPCVAVLGDVTPRAQANTGKTAF